MPTSEKNRPWGLEAFLDSLVKNLDDWQETLAVKGITRPLTYTIQDVALELQCFPQFDGNEVRFVTAGPGEPGASNLRFQLGSISASSIRDTAPKPVSRDEVMIEKLDELPSEAKEKLNRLGVKTESDLRRMEERNVDLDAVTGGAIGDYSDLANAINRAKRARMSPGVRKAEMASAVSAPEAPMLTLHGEHLYVDARDARFPIATVDGREVPVVEASPEHVVIRLPRRPSRSQPMRVDLALDAFAVISMELHQ